MKKFLLTVLILLLLAGLAFMALGFYLPYFMAKCEGPYGAFLLTEEPGEGWRLQWPEAENADFYCVELLDGEALLYRDFVKAGTEMMLPQLPGDKPLTLRVSAAADFHTPLGDSVRYSEDVLEETLRFEAPAVTVSSLEIDGDARTAAVHVSLSDSARWYYALADADGNVIADDYLSEDSLLLTFGEDAIPLPDEDSFYLLKIRPFREEDGAVFYGASIQDQAIPGESLYPKLLNPVLTETVRNSVKLTWDETRGSGYEVHRYSDGGWDILKTYTLEEERVFTAMVEPGETVRLRVAALNDRGEPLQLSEELDFTGRDNLLYATVWPSQTLPAYANPSGSGERPVDKAMVGQAYCVLGETKGMFKVRINGRELYIDSNYCMINLPDYLGGLCTYDITNSYDSRYAVHGFPIPNVTGYVTGGYEDILQEDGQFLVPILYPTAQKLKRAAEAALDQGFRLKIYDAFRPYNATREVYDLTEPIMDWPIPDTTYWGVPASSMELPAPEKGTDVLTYGWLMTGHGYELRSFLARNGSTHNLGYALDLTMEDAVTGEEAQMQTAIHDLSQFSVLKRNNDMAKKLEKIMKNAGFKGLNSEWWHFQDNGTRDKLDLNPVMTGVSAQRWVYDGIGWKYATPKGGFVKGETLEIDGETHTFNANGYVE